jgi:hypothetical protein
VPFDAFPAEALAVQLTRAAGIDAPAGGVKFAASARTEITKRVPFGGGQDPPVNETTDGAGEPGVATATFVTLNVTPTGTVTCTVSCAQLVVANAQSPQANRPASRPHRWLSRLTARPPA